MTLLRAEHLTRSFSGLVAVDDVSFEVGEGEIVGLIGPNGAGKTTLFNLLAGSMPPTSGRVLLDGTDITGWPAHRVAAAGMGRTFQLMKPFGTLSVLDNVVVAAHLHAGSHDEAVEIARAVVDRVGLADDADRDAAVLPTASRKRLEVARALATRPRVLLLDEVLSGLVPSERTPVLDMLRAIRDEGTALMFVEHVMAAVMSLSDRVLVLHHGELLASGTPAEITEDPAVVEAYLGEEDMLSADS